MDGVPAEDCLLHEMKAYATHPDILALQVPRAAEDAALAKKDLAKALADMADWRYGMDFDFNKSRVEEKMETCDKLYKEDAFVLKYNAKIALNNVARKSCGSHDIFIIHVTVVM